VLLTEFKSSKDIVCKKWSLTDFEVGPKGRGTQREGDPKGGGPKRKGGPKGRGTQREGDPKGEALTYLYFIYLCMFLTETLYVMQIF
jgi:hypothetical protein